VEKKGLWGRIWRAVVGEANLGDEDEEWEDDDEEGVQQVPEASIGAKPVPVAVSIPSR
jgi:heme o synthase